MASHLTWGVPSWLLKLLSSWPLDRLLSQKLRGQRQSHSTPLSSPVAPLLRRLMSLAALADFCLLPSDRIYPHSPLACSFRSLCCKSRLHSRYNTPDRREIFHFSQDRVSSPQI